MDFLYSNQRELFSLIKERTEPRSLSYEGEYVTKSSVKRSFGLHTKFPFIMSNKCKNPLTDRQAGFVLLICLDF